MLLEPLGLAWGGKSKAATRQNTSPRDDAPQSLTCFAQAPARIPSSGVRRRFLPGVAMQTALSDLPDSGRQDNRSYTAIRDTFDETDLGCATNRLPQCPALLSSTGDGTRPGLLPFPRSVHAGRDTSCTRRLRINVEFQPKTSHRSLPEL